MTDYIERSSLIHRAGDVNPKRNALRFFKATTGQICAEMERQGETDTLVVMISYDEAKQLGRDLVALAERLEGA